MNRTQQTSVVSPPFLVSIVETKSSRPPHSEFAAPLLVLRQRMDGGRKSKAAHNLLGEVVP